MLTAPSLASALVLPKKLVLWSKADRFKRLNCQFIKKYANWNSIKRLQQKEPRVTWSTYRSIWCSNLATLPTVPFTRRGPPSCGFIFMGFLLALILHSFLWVIKEKNRVQEKGLGKLLPWKTSVTLQDNAWNRERFGGKHIIRSRRLRGRIRT